MSEINLIPLYCEIEKKEKSFSDIRQEIFKQAKEFFNLEEYSADYKKVVLYARDGTSGICELHINDDHQAVLIDFLDSRGSVKVYFLHTKSVYCIGVNEHQERRFYYASGSKSVIFFDYASCWDCFDYEDHTTERASFKIIYDTVSGECKTDYDKSED